MKLTIQRADLIKAIGAAQRVVERRNTIPVLANLLLTASGSALEIKATDLDIEITTTALASVDAPGSITAPAHLLHDIARKLPEGAEIALDFTNNAGGTIRSGRSRFQVQTLPADQFPDISAGEMSHAFEMPAADLARLIADTDFAISTEETRYYLNGIYLHTVEAEGATILRAVATDGHRLARSDMTAPEGAAGMPGIIIPRKAVAEIARLLDKAGEAARLSLSASKLMLEIGQTRLVTKLIDGTFPDYARVIPASNNNRATLDIQAMLAAVDRVSTISSERGRAVKLAFADGRLKLSVSNPDAGSADDEIEAEHDGEPLEIGMNARYLADILGVLIRNGAESVTMKMDTPGSPAILMGADNTTLLTVLMPMRI